MINLKLDFLWLTSVYRTFLNACSLGCTGDSTFFFFFFNLGPTHGRSSLRLAIFFPSQAKHVGANVVSLLNTAMALVPEGLDR